MFRFVILREPAYCPAMIGLVAIVALSATPSTTPYELDPAPHAVFSIASLALVGAIEAFVKPNLRGGLACDAPDGAEYCDPSQLNAVDRTVVGNNSKTWRWVSDFGMYVILSGALFGSALDNWFADSPTPMRDFLIDSLVILEAVAVSVMITHIVKYATRRARPTQYSVVGPKRGVSSQLGFPSGHASTAAVAATAYATTFSLRYPDSPWRFVLYGGATAVTLLTSYGRVGGGRHFYTDILGGLLIGVGVGVIIPYVHLQSPQRALSVTPILGQGTYGLGVGGIF